MNVPTAVPTQAEILRERDEFIRSLAIEGLPPASILAEIEAKYPYHTVKLRRLLGILRRLREVGS